MRVYVREVYFFPHNSAGLQGDFLFIFYSTTPVVSITHLVRLCKPNSWLSWKPERVCVCVRVYVCMCVCMCVCVNVYGAYARVYGDTV